MNSNSGFLAWVMDPKRRGPMLIAPAVIVLLLINIVPLMWSFGLSFLSTELTLLNRQNLVGFTTMKKWYRKKVFGKHFKQQQLLLQEVLEFKWYLVFF